MIGALKGTVVGAEGNVLIVDVHGVGYLVTVSTGALALANEGKEVSLLIVTEVRENDISLIGFSNRNERAVFLLLRKVKGIGAKLALAILSGLGPEQLLSAIGRQDISLLNKVPGVGKKTAERIIVELREQVGILASESIPRLSSRIVVSRGDTEGSPAVVDAILALEKLGFDRNRATRAIEQVVAKKPQGILDAGLIVREALIYL